MADHSSVQTARPLPGQRQFSSLVEPHFDHLAISDGLSQEAILAIARDRMGYMWFGTQEGLNRFDGYQFHVYSRDDSDPNALSNEWIWCLLCDADGQLWAGTNGGGLARYQPDTDNFVIYRQHPLDPHSVASDVIRALHQDASGELWLGTDQGLQRYLPEEDRFTEVIRPHQRNHLPQSAKIRVIIDHPEQGLWIGSDGYGIGRYLPGERVIRWLPQDRQQPAYGRVRHLYQDEGNRLWVGTYNHGLQLLSTHPDNSSNGQPRLLSHDSLTPLRPLLKSERSAIIRCFMADEAQRLWIGTDDGLLCWDPERQTLRQFRHRPENRHTLCDNRISTLFQDESGLIWVGTLGGLDRWNPRTTLFSKFDAGSENLQPLSSYIINALLQDSDRQLWVGTHHGLDRVDLHSGKVRHYPWSAERPEGEQQRIMSLWQDSHDQLWIGTLDTGLALLNRQSGQWRFFRHDADDPGSLRANGIVMISPACRGRMWLATFGGGLERFDPYSGQFEHFEHDSNDPQTLSSNRIMCVRQTRNGMVWAGTWDGGLNRLDPASGKVQRFRHQAGDPTSIGSDLIVAIHEDWQGNLWLATQGDGLQLLSKDEQLSRRYRFVRYSRARGLLSSTVYGILEDEKGDLWLSGNRGLARFSVRKQQFEHFSPLHGLQGYEFNAGACHLGPDGMMFFGGNNGFNAFYPAQINTTEHRPRLAVTRIKTGQQCYATPGQTCTISKLSLAADDRQLRIDLAAMDFTQPEQSRFRYQLVGFDKQWNQLNESRSLVYTNLPGGDYLLKLQAASLNGQWNTKQRFIAVSVASPRMATRLTRWLQALLSAGSAPIAAKVQRFQYLRLAARNDQLQERLFHCRQQAEQQSARLTALREQMAELNQRVASCSMTDELTGVASRRNFTIRLHQHRARLIADNQSRSDPERPAQPGSRWRQRHLQPQKLCLMFIRLTDLKQLNSRYGTETGDQALIATVRQIKRLLHPDDRVGAGGVAGDEGAVFRWSNAEFLLLCQAESLISARHMAGTLSQWFDDTRITLPNGKQHALHCPIGFCLSPCHRGAADQDNGEQLLALAEAAWQLARRNPDNGWVGFAQRESSGYPEPNRSQSRNASHILAKAGRLAPLGQEMSHLLASGELKLVMSHQSQPATAEAGQS